MLQNTKRYKTIVTNIYEKHFFVCDIEVSVKQNQFKKIVSI